MNSNCAELINFSHSDFLKKPPLSISGIVIILPDLGGYSISQVLVQFIFPENSALKAHAYTILPAFCLIDPRSINGASAATHVSS